MKAFISQKYPIAIFFLWTLLALSPLYSNLNKGLFGPVDAWLNIYTLRYLGGFFFGSFSNLTELGDGLIFAPWGHSLGLTDMLAGVVPIYWLFEAVVREPVLAYNLTILAVLGLNFGCMRIFLLRRAMPEQAATLGALIFTFSPLIIVHLGHLQLLSAWWIPLTLHFTYRFFETSSFKSLLLLSLFGLLQFLTSVYLAVYLCTAILLIFLLNRGWVPLYRSASRAPIQMLIFMGILLLALVTVSHPYRSASSFYNATRSLEENLNFSADFYSYLSVSSTNLVYGKSRLLFKAFSERELFIGFVPLALTVFALTRAFRSSLLRDMLVLGLVGFLFSLGPVIHLNGIAYTSPYHYLFEYLTPFQAMRVPARWAYLFLLACSVIAALGFTVLLRFKLSLLTVVFLFGLLAAEQIQRRDMNFYPASLNVEDRELIASLAKGEGTVIFWPVVHVAAESSALRYLGQIREAKRSVMATYFGRRIVNGYSGIEPKPYQRLVRHGLSAEPKDFVRSLLVENVRTVVFVKSLMKRNSRKAFRKFGDIVFDSKHYQVIELQPKSEEIERRRQLSRKP